MRLPSTLALGLASLALLLAACTVGPGAGYPLELPVGFPTPFVPEDNPLTVDNPGSDFMVDVLKTLELEYIIANPASSFRGLHESFINYGGNSSPEWLTCTHEQAAVNIANGYYAVAGKPMAVATFAPSGLQHAAMGIFGAFSGRTPTYLLCANIVGGEDRRPLFDWGRMQ